MVPPQTALESQERGASELAVKSQPQLSDWIEEREESEQEERDEAEQPEGVPKHQVQRRIQSEQVQHRDAHLQTHFLRLGVEIVQSKVIEIEGVEGVEIVLVDSSQQS